jgi:hypothetical protein
VCFAFLSRPSRVLLLQDSSNNNNKKNQNITSKMDFRNFGLLLIPVQMLVMNLLPLEFVFGFATLFSIPASGESLISRYGLNHWL